MAFRLNSSDNAGVTSVESAFRLKTVCALLDFFWKCDLGCEIFLQLVWNM